MPDSVKRLLEVYNEVVEQIELVLLVLFSEDSTIEDAFSCAPP